MGESNIGQDGTDGPVLQRFELRGSPWPTVDPFLFCVHHNDAYPKGNGALAPAVATTGRSMGSDFSGRDGWSMYHGMTVPGFPQHPHRGFETVTFVRRGFVDHSDSLRAQARYGAGDVQWLTAGAGIVHSEMFPLLSAEQDNPLELFQIWLNLPAKNKMAEPYFTMLWSETIPVVEYVDADGRRVEVTVVAGSIGDAVPPPPPPDSWASQPGSDVAIWRISMQDGATWTMPAAPEGVLRSVYVFEGEALTVGSDSIGGGTGAVLDASTPLLAVARGEVTVLVLQGRMIGEPVAQYGPFVMNDRAGIERAISDYQRTGYGGWPWSDDAPTHGQTAARFARRPTGDLELPPGADPAVVG
jgi:quercetin 2,3-dioxygenase